MPKLNDTLAIVVDIQERMIPAMENKLELEKNCITLIKGLKELGIPLIITQQYTKGLGMTIPTILEAAGTEQFYEKTSFSVMKDETTAKAIKDHQKKNVIVLGIEAHICVLQTCIDLKEQGLNPILVLDCISSRKTSNVEMTTLRAVQEGITITSYESILFELMESSDIVAFRTISKLVR